MAACFWIHPGNRKNDGGRMRDIVDNSEEISNVAAGGYRWPY